MIDASVTFYSLTGLVVGILSGLLGIGGGLLVIPAALFLSPVFLQNTLSLPLITGLSSVQAAASSASSAYTHFKQKRLLVPLVLLLGSSAMAGSYIGGLYSASISPSVIKLIYVGVSVLALCGYLFKPTWHSNNEQSSVASFSFSQVFSFQNLKQPDYLCSVIFAFLIGGLSGILGIGGSVFMIPVITVFLGTTVHQAIGTAAGTVFLIAIAATAGKLQVGLIPWKESALIIVAAFIGGRIGALITPYIKSHWLKALLVILLLLSNAKMLTSE